MAREVWVCLQCNKQGAESWGFCPTCGPTNCMNLDDWARMVEKTHTEEQAATMKQESDKPAAE